MHTCESIKTLRTIFDLRVVYVHVYFQYVYSTYAFKKHNKCINKSRSFSFENWQQTLEARLAVPVICSSSAEQCCVKIMWTKNCLQYMHIYTQKCKFLQKSTNTYRNFQIHLVEYTQLRIRK